uniref:Uncharacterized protein n=1 Tax=Acrobeloides nanus TaxID=290746 RepID=A0A914DRM0_9BILA
MGDSDVEYLHTVHFADISDNESRVIDATGDGYVPGDQEIGGNDDVSNYINIWDSEIPEEEPE